MLPNKEVKYIQSLSQKKMRQQLGIFVAEGPKQLQELLKRQPHLINKIYGTASWWQLLPAPIQLNLLPLYVEIEPFELKKISFLQTPQLVLALVNMPPANNLLGKFNHLKWVLALDDIQDPGNMGTIIRTAHWYGIEQIICSPACADVFAPKVVQASMGSIYAVDILQQDLPLFFNQNKLPVYGAMLQGKAINKIQQTEVGILLIGNEGKGISQTLLPFINQAITIPGKSDAESLNAAVAAGILMQHLVGKAIE